MWTWVLESDDTYDVEATAQRVEQLVPVTAGELRVVAGGDVLILGNGDSAVVKGNITHRYANRGPGTCRFVQVSQSAAS